jgi:D-aspartate ligase
MLDIDFRFDARDGKYKVLDINPRIGATFRLFVDPNGMDVVRTMYLDITRQTIRSGSALDGRRWCVEDCDLLSSAHALFHRNLRVRDWIASYGGVAEWGVFAADDPVPAIWTALGDLRRVFRTSQ